MCVLVAGGGGGGGMRCGGQGSVRGCTRTRDRCELTPHPRQQCFKQEPQVGLSRPHPFMFLRW